MPEFLNGRGAGGSVNMSRITALLCLLLLYLEGSNGTLSGFYADNGVDQTVLQRVISPKEKRAVQDEILHLLGLPEKPRVMKKRSSASAPQFLLDVYKSMLDNPSPRSTRSQFSLSEQERDAIQESDKIISFASRSHHVANVRHEKGKRLWFDVSEVGAGESIVGSELRLYQSPVYPLPPEQKYTVTLYRVLHSRLNGEEGLEIVESVNTTNDREGWLIFNTTGSLALWVAFPNLNKGFYLSIQAYGSGHEYLPETIGLTTKPGDKQPFMVAFLRGDEHRAQVRVRRQARHRKKKSDHGETSYLKNPFSSPQESWPQSHRSCKIQNLFVSFEDLEWEDWIIAPKGYSADYCSGECNFPLNAHMNATNHAIVQTLVHLMNPLQVPKPCCAPTRLKPISVLYFVDDYNVMIKKYNNMVVKSCGCH